LVTAGSPGPYLRVLRSRLINNKKRKRGTADAVPFDHETGKQVLRLWLLKNNAHSV